MASPDPNANRVTFHTLSTDAELQEMEREVDMLQEDLKLKNLQQTAAEDEGARKKVAATGTAANGAKSIFISGFDPRVTANDLKIFFSSCGTIGRITLLRDKATGQNNGSAYMEFETQEQAQAALLKEGQSFHGRPLKVAIKRENIPGYHRGGYGAPRGRGGNPWSGQQMGAAAMAMLSMMGGGNMNFSPFPNARGRGRGRGRGGPQ